MSSNYIGSSKATIKSQHAKLTVDYDRQIKQNVQVCVSALQAKAQHYKRPRQNEDFVIDDDEANPKDPALDDSQIGGGAVTIGVNGEDMLATNPATSTAPIPKEKTNQENPIVIKVTTRDENLESLKCETPIQLGTI